MKTWNVTVKTDTPNESGCYETTISVQAKNAGHAMSEVVKNYPEIEETIVYWLLVAPEGYED